MTRREQILDEAHKQACHEDDFILGAEWADKNNKLQAICEKLWLAVEPVRSFMLEEDIRHYTQALVFEEMYETLKKTRKQVGRKDEIWSAAYLKSDTTSGCQATTVKLFVYGAEWADANPPAHEHNSERRRELRHRIDELFIALENAREESALIDGRKDPIETLEALELYDKAKEK